MLRYRRLCRYAKGVFSCVNVLDNSMKLFDALPIIITIILVIMMAMNMILMIIIVFIFRCTFSRERLVLS